MPYQGQRDFGSILSFLNQNKAAKAKNFVWATIKGLLGQLAGIFMSHAYWAQAPQPRQGASKPQQDRAVAYPRAL